MWMFTKYGFFSVVCARTGDGRRSQPVDPDRMMVRARVRSHLESLQIRFPDLLKEHEIQEFAGTDYAFRLFVPKAAWGQLVAGLAEEISYDNFKAEVGRHHSRAGAAYERSLHEVWAVMNRLQTRRRQTSSPAEDSTHDLDELIGRFDTDEKLVESDAFRESGTAMLFPRLHRAALNQATGGEAMESRYAIWATTLREQIGEALQCSQADPDAARKLLIKAQNSLSAFAELQQHFEQTH